MVERIKWLRDILGDEAKVMALIREELLEIRDRYGDDRRTQITHSEDEIDIEDLIADQQMVIAITRSGYIKTLPLATYRQQKRGGIGVTGMDMKDEDYIEHLFVSSTHDYLLFFTNRGKVYRQKVYELPEAQRTAKGRALVNLLPLREGERVQAVQATRDFKEGKYLVFATRKGQIKKTEFLAYNTPIKADGIIAINIRDDDELVAGAPDQRRRRHHHGLALRARRPASTRTRCAPMGRDTAGVKGMNVSRGDNRVLAMDVVRPDTELLVVTENGYGKRTAIEEYPVKGRGSMGVKTIGLTEKKGGVAGALIVRDHHDLVFISQNGMVQRTSVKGISKQGRPGAGRARDEPARRRHGERRGARHGERRRHVGRGAGGARRAGDGRRAVLVAVEPTRTTGRDGRLRRAGRRRARLRVGPGKKRGAPHLGRPSHGLLDVIGGSTTTGGTNPGQISPTSATVGLRSTGSSTGV